MTPFDTLAAEGWLVQSLGQIGVSGGWLAILAHGLDIHTGTGSTWTEALYVAYSAPPRTGYIRGIDPDATISLRSLLPHRPVYRRF